MSTQEQAEAEDKAAGMIEKLTAAWMHHLVVAARVRHDALARGDLPQAAQGVAPGRQQVLAAGREGHTVHLRARVRVADRVDALQAQRNAKRRANMSQSAARSQC